MQCYHIIVILDDAFTGQSPQSDLYNCYCKIKISNDLQQGQYWSSSGSEKGLFKAKPYKRKTEQDRTSLLSIVGIFINQNILPLRKPSSRSQLSKCNRGKEFLSFDCYVGPAQLDPIQCNISFTSCSRHKHMHGLQA